MSIVFGHFGCFPYDDVDDDGGGDCCCSSGGVKNIVLLTKAKLSRKTYFKLRVRVDPFLNNLGRSIGCDVSKLVFDAALMLRQVRNQ